MKKQRKVTESDLPHLGARNENQKQAIKAFESKNLVLSGCAGTGKTYLALSLGIQQVLEKGTPYHELILIRSIVPTRDIGFLPGDESEKKDAYTGPYKAIFQEIFKCVAPWENLIASNLLSFESTSFIRGTTYNNAVIIVDESQNLNYHELSSVITRVGQDCKIIFSGDPHQSDFLRAKDKKGLKDFLSILEKMPDRFKIITFTVEDIVRSGLVKDFIINEQLALGV
jgi:phosphate starvation-inducible PhoH-like protein